MERCFFYLSEFYFFSKSATYFVIDPFVVWFFKFCKTKNMKFLAQILFTRKTSAQNLSWNLFLLGCWECPEYIVMLSAELLQNLIGGDYTYFSNYVGLVL